MYIHKETHTLGAVCGLHFLYHSAVTDLTRITLPGYDFPLAAAFRSAPSVFVRQCQERCRYHADMVVNLVRLGLRIGTQAFDDPHCAMAAFESTKIQIVHTVTATPNRPPHRDIAEEHIKSNLQLLGASHFLGTGTNPYVWTFPVINAYGCDH